MAQATPKPVTVGTSAELAAYLPSVGELTHESDTGLFKAGDGAQLHAALPVAGAAQIALINGKTTWSEGTLAARPTAAAAFAAAGGPVLYFATDDNGGTVYKTATGTSWTKIAAGATESTGQLIAQFEKQDTFATASTTAVDITGLTGMGVTGWGGDVKMRICIPVKSSVTTNRIIFQIVDDLANQWIAWPQAAPALTTADVWLNVTRRIPAASIPNGTTRTFKAQMYTAGAATVTLDGSSTDPALIEFFRG